jgi:hypothetical protein
VACQLQHGVTHGFVSVPHVELGPWIPGLMLRRAHLFVIRADPWGGFPKVVEFASTQDRDYYVGQDPAHQKVKESMSSLVESVVVVDWENGQF